MSREENNSPLKRFFHFPLLGDREGATWQVNNCGWKKFPFSSYDGVSKGGEEKRQGLNFHMHIHKHTHTHTLSLSLSLSLSHSLAYIVHLRNDLNLFLTYTPAWMISMHSICFKQCRHFLQAPSPQHFRASSPIQTSFLAR